MNDENIQKGSDPDKEDAHPSVQNGGLRERKKACDSLGPNALLIVLLVSSVQPQREFGKSRKLVCRSRKLQTNIVSAEMLENVNFKKKKNVS